jgi:hypothetical protein
VRNELAQVNEETSIFTESKFLEVATEVMRRVLSTSISSIDFLFIQRSRFVEEANNSFEHVGLNLEPTSIEFPYAEKTPFYPQSCV